MASKTQIDRLGERLKAGDETAEDLRLLDDYRRSFFPAYQAVLKLIRERLTLAPTGREAKTTGAIVSKLRRETIRLSQIQDIAGCRLVVPDIEAQDIRVSQLLDVFQNPVLMDRRLKPSHGYRAVHVTCTVGERNVEIQVRTSLQHFWAQWSEKLADVLGDEVKYGGGERIVATTLRVTSGAEGSTGGGG